MKRFFLGSLFAGSLLALVTFAPPAKALELPHWDVTGHYVSTFMYLGSPYAHDMDLVQDGDGNVTGSGGYPAGGAHVYAWTIDSGTVVGDTINLTAHYTASADAVTPLTVMTMTGTINADGTMSGTWHDNYQAGDRNGDWSTTAGAANVTFEPAWGKELSAASCEGKVGGPVINVTQKVTGDADSGFGGYWAHDSYNRHIQVWRTGSKTSNTYCALVTYEGTANAVAGQTGPAGGTGVIGEGVSAEMKGGYRTTIFTGTLRSTPLLGWKTKGTIGAIDYGCDLSGACSDLVNWSEQYFTGLSGFGKDWWGWLYDAGSHGSWLNSIDGNWGDIL